MAEETDYYKILGVERTDTADEIKRAYKKVAIKYHPDRNPGDKEAEEKFKQAAQAYDVLRDPDKRARYDQFGAAGVDGAAGGFGGFGGGRGQRQYRGSDMRMKVRLTLEEISTGVTKKFKVRKDITCNECHGTGCASGHSPETCPTCHGQGYVIQSRRSFLGMMQTQEVCPNCHGEGTIIKNKIDGDQKPIKGISSINGTALITVTGLSMVGVIGVNRRIFTALANEGISVFMVSQASSENSTSIGVREQDVEEAVKVLNNEFHNEIADGAMFPMHAEKGLATIAIVGENMKHAAGIAGKLFGTLGRSGISVIACAQGASETNISFVVKSDFLRKSLNVLHDSFFLSEYKVLNLFICGVGTVGGKLIEQIKNQYKELKERNKLKLNVVGIASSHNAIFDRDGLDLDNYREALKASEPSTNETLKEKILNMNIFNSVFVDCTASKDVASLYQSLLEHNVSVIAANKIAASSEYENYERLKKTAIQRGVVFRFETNVGAGLPIIGTINDLRNSGDKILKIEAVLSGTLNFIFNAISGVVPFSETVRLAKEKGYSEPDPRIDLSGMDVVRKLVILSREAGYRVEQDDVEKNLFVPDEYFQGSLDDFWKKLPELDAEFEAKRKTLDIEHKRWRFVATLDGGKTSVGLQAVGPEHPFYNLEGSNNIVLLTTERYKEYPMMIQGYGAGASVTAAGVFANIMSIANI